MRGSVFERVVAENMDGLHAKELGPFLDASKKIGCTADVEMRSIESSPGALSETNPEWRGWDVCLGPTPVAA